jgi:hypothetical protein
MIDRYAGRGRHAEAEKVHTTEKVHTEGRQAEGLASERARAHLAAYRGPITKCEPGIARDRALSASTRVAKAPPQTS